MCELFGLSASQRIAGPVLPLIEVQARGGATADNPDGWGVAWRDNSDIVATEPLGNAEGWTPFEAADLRTHGADLPVGRIPTHPGGVDSRPLQGIQHDA